jgi:hypothetical protein
MITLESKTSDAVYGALFFTSQIVLIVATLIALA